MITQNVDTLIFHSMGRLKVLLNLMIHWACVFLENRMRDCAAQPRYLLLDTGVEL